MNQFKLLLFVKGFGNTEPVYHIDTVNDNNIPVIDLTIEQEIPLIDLTTEEEEIPLIDLTNEEETDEPINTTQETNFEVFNINYEPPRPSSQIIDSTIEEQIEVDNETFTALNR